MAKGTHVRANGLTLTECQLASPKWLVHATSELLSLVDFRPNRDHLGE